MAKNNSIIGILINIQKAGGGDKQAIAALKNLQKGISEAATIFGTLTAAAVAVEKGIEATVGKFNEYAKVVRDVMNVTGLQADYASRLVQVTEDLGVSHEALTKSMLALSKKGIDPSVQSLAKLSDQYLKLAPGAEQVQFLTDNFGKSGADMARVMETGSQSLMAMNDAVSKYLVLSDQGVAAAEANVVATENLKEKYDELAITIGGKLAPVFTRLMDMTIDYVEALDEVGPGVFRAAEAFKVFAEERIAKNRQELIDARDHLEGIKEGGLDAADGLDAAARAADTLSAAERELNTIQVALSAGLSGEYAKSYDTYSQKHLEAAAAIAKARDELEQMYATGNVDQQRVAELNKTIQDNAVANLDAEKAMKKAIATMIYQQAAAGLDARSALKLARQLGLISDADYAIADAVETLKQRRDEEIKQTGDAKAANDKYIKSVADLNKAISGLPPEQVVTVVTNFVTNGTPPPTGSGTTTTTTSGGHEQGTGGPGGYASGGVSTGPSSGHYELLHGTEYVLTQSQFGDMVRAISNIANGAGAGGGPTYVTVNYSGSNFSELLQSIEMAAARKY